MAAHERLRTIAPCVWLSEHRPPFERPIDVLAELTGRRITSLGFFP